MNKNRTENYVDGEITEAKLDATLVAKVNGVGLNHTHTLSQVTDAGDSAGLSVGTTAGTVAAGDHGHELAAITDAGAAAALAVGTTAGTVAAGDHDHDADYAATSHSHAIGDVSGVVPAAQGGAGTVTGILKADGLGTVSAASAGTDYLTPTGNGSALTSLNGSNISSGTLADARLSSNVPLLNAANTFAETQQVNGTEITIANKNKHQAILSDASGTFLRHQTQYWNGSEYKATHGWGVGLGALQNNAGHYSNGVGHGALQNNAGHYSNGFGYVALQNNTGAYSSGFGPSALQNNTGGYSNGVGYYALQNNTGAGSNGVGYYALQYNTGNYSSGFGPSALRNNTGNYSNGFGYVALQNNNWPYVLAIGHQAGLAFTANAATAKTFETANITANTITFGSAHGFPGADGSKINLLFTATAGTPPAGLVSGTVYQFTRTSSTVMTLSGIGADASGDFAGKLENSIDTSNTIVLGNGANATKANQVVLGADTITETVLRGNVGIGTTSPTYALHVAPTSGATAGQTAFFQNATPSTGKTRAVFKAGAGDTAADPILQIQDNAGTVILSFMDEIREAVDDTAAAALTPAVPVGGVYRTGSILKIRIA
jgi:hypothetical protein